MKLFRAEIETKTLFYLDLRHECNKFVGRIYLSEPVSLRLLSF